MDRNLALDAVRITEAAALATARLMGRGDARAATATAVRSMRRAFDTIEFCGTIVIGEGQMAEAPSLYAGEKVGRWQEGGWKVDLAVKPLEGANPCAYGGPNAISVIAMARGGRFLPAPDTYMLKMAVGPAGKGALDLKQSATWNLNAVADAKGVYVEDLTVVILDRPRHESLIREVREAGARIKLIRDGDVAAAIATCKEETGIDLLMGVGGAPEGVLAAAALRCIGGDMLAQFKPKNHEEIESLKRVGLGDLERIYQVDDLASGDILFGATGVTDGDLLKGVRFKRGGASTHSIVMRSKTATLRFLETEHRFDFKPDHTI